MIVDALFPAYHFNKSDTDDFVVIDQSSYVWAAFGGPLFVLSKGLYVLALIDLLAMMVIAGGVLLALTATAIFFSASVEGMLLMLIIVPLAGLVLNAIVAVRLVRYGYLQRGWRLGY